MNEEAQINMEESIEGFDHWASKEFLTAETKDKIGKAEVLIVPDEDFRDGISVSFPTATEELFQFLQEELAQKHPVEIAIEDKDYKELALHGATVIFAGFVVTSIVAPIVVHVLGKYIDKKFFNDPKKDENNLKIELTIEERNGEQVKIRRISYDGPVEFFQKKLGEAIENEFPTVIEHKHEDD